MNFKFYNTTKATLIIVKNKKTQTTQKNMTKNAKNRVERMILPKVINRWR